MHLSSKVDTAGFTGFTRDAEGTVFFGAPVHLALWRQAEPDATPTARMYMLGGQEIAQVDVERLRSFGAPDEESVSVMSLRDLHFMNDEAYPPMRVTIDEQPVDALSDELIDAFVSALRQAAGGGARSVEIIPRRGAFERAPEFPSALREAVEEPTWSVGPGVWWEDESEDDLHVRWVEDVVASIRRIGLANDRHHPNGVGVTLDLEGVARMYGDRFERLRDLKRQWDPDNVFAGTHNIPPAGS
jgi:FAD/FMN-containing dehydrogenase